MPDDDAFASLAERHLGPVLASAGFAAGQWGSGRRTTQTLTADSWTTIEQPWSESGTYCAGAADYVRRHADVAAGREERYGAAHPSACVDIVVEGTLADGVTSVQVEFEDLAQLLRALDREHDAEVVEAAIASGSAEGGLVTIAAVLQRLYLPGHPTTVPT